MKRVRAGGVTWAVEEWGEAHGPVVFLLHGFAGRGYLWRELSSLLPREFRYLAPDLPGHGETRWPETEFTFTGAVDALAGLIAEAGASPAKVLGYSLGGRLALGLAASHPRLVDRIVLEGALAGLEDPGARARRIAADDALAESLVAGGLEAFVDRWESLPLFATQARAAPARLAEQRRARTSHQADSLAAALRAFSPGRQPPYTSRLREVRAQTLLIAGELDVKFRTIASSLARGIPGARARIITGAGHNTHLEEPGAFAATAGPFLAGAEASGGKPVEDSEK